MGQTGDADELFEIAGNELQAVIRDDSRFGVGIFFHAARGFCKLRKSWSKVRFRSETKPGRRRAAPGPENQIPIPIPYPFAFQAIERSAIVKQRVRAYLEGDHTLEVGILCEPNDAHAAAADDFLQRVAAKDSLSGSKPRDLNCCPQIQIFWKTIPLHKVLVIGSVNHFNCFLQHHWRTGLSERAEERTSG